jgi:hypothetical protein
VKSIINWLLQGDPAVVYQTKRDLLDTPTDELEQLQVKMVDEGWAHKLLSYQEPSGMWGGSLYSPKWTSTHYTLMSLMRLGLPHNNPQAQKGCRILLDAGFYRDGGINYFASLKHSETCVTAMTLSLLCYFQIKDDRLFSLYNFLLDQQMSDGGWNCNSFNGAMHSSFHTTITTLEALRQYELMYVDKNGKIELARKKAHEFLLCHHLFKSDKTGAVVSQAMTRFSFPPRWKYDVMRGLDYFQEINAPHDPRFCDAITLLRRKEKKGKWPLQQKHPGRIFFEMEPVGKPSRINTLRALRILKWWSSKPQSSC